MKSKSDYRRRRAIASSGIFGEIPAWMRAARQMKLEWWDEQGRFLPYGRVRQKGVAR